jgi:transposase InsO family protein
MPLKVHTAAEVAQALITTFGRFGFPKSILSDLGSEFQSQLMQIFSHEYNFSQIITSVPHPMTDGVCERFNGNLKSMLTAICDRYPYSWDTVSPEYCLHTGKYQWKRSDAVHLNYYSAYLFQGLCLLSKALG